MATSGSKSVTVTSWDTLKFTWNLKSQSVANNSSVISWTLQLIAGSSGAINSSASKSWSVTVNGTKYSGTNTIGISNNATKTLASGETTVAHSSNGTKTFNFSFSQQFDITFSGSWIGTKSGSGSGTPTTIPRKSELTAGNGTLGTEQTITVTRKSTSFSHTLTYKCGTASGTIVSRSTTTSVKWTPPASLASQAPADTKVSVTLTLTTYNGTGSTAASIGSVSKTISCAIPNTVAFRPSCSLTLEDTSGWDDTYGSPVQGLSTIKVKVNTTPAYGSAISSYAVTIDGVKYTKGEFTTGVLKISGASPVAATVKDKRGRSGGTTYAMAVQPYAKPSISKLTAQRCNQDGTTNDQGAYVKVTFSAAITSLGSKNTAAYTLRYKKSTVSSYTSETLSALANTYTLTDSTYIFPADVNSSYDIELRAQDRHGTATREAKASTAATLINWNAAGNGMAFFKVSEKANALEIGKRIYDEYGMHLSNGMSLYGGSANHIDANTTTEHLILTALNTPDTSLWYVTTIFYSTKRATSDRRQTAVPYRRSGPTYTRYYTGGAWTDWESELLRAWPVGSIYLSYNHTNPGTTLGGTWTRIQGAFLWATDAAGTIGQTGGEREVTLTTSQIPSHSHGSVYSQHANGTKDKAWYTASGSSLAYGAVATGGGQAHNNMPPYIQVSVWRRTA